jgi:DNA-binding transcriptional MerR regulator
MYGIGTVARLAQVSVRTLRYYDELGLLRPAWVDPDTGYRWYSPDQLQRLHRIIALRDLGVRLADIVTLLDEPVTVDELRGILRLRQAEGRQRMAAEADRLARVEARLQQLEEDSMATYDIITKKVDAVWVAAASEDVADHGQIGFAEQRLWPRIDKALADCQIEQAPGPAYAIDTASGNSEAPVRVTCAVPVPEGAAIDRDGVSTTLLPALELAAATVIHGDPNYPEAFDALMGWADSTGHKRAGEGREVYLDCDGPRDTWVVELQVALEP